MIKFLLSLLLLIICSCSSKPSSKLYFQISTVGLFEQVTILDFEKEKPVHFSQYEGFYITAEDSIFKKIVLEIKSQDLISSNEITKDQIDKLKSDIVENLSIQYSLESIQERAEVESNLRSKFKQYSILERNDGFWVKDKCDNVIAKTVFYSSVVPNFKIIIYPSTKQCLQF